MPLLSYFREVYMRSARKFEYLKKRNKQLEEALGRAESAKKVLQVENDSLRNQCDAANAVIAKMELECDVMTQKYRAAIADAVEAKKHYDALIKECLLAKNEYARMMEKLLNNARSVQFM